MCGHINNAKTFREHRTGKRSPKSFHINSRVVHGCLHAGIGQTHINNLLSTANILGFTNKTFKQREQVGAIIENVAIKGFKRWKNVLKNVCPQWCDSVWWEQSCSLDMGWQKRGRGHYSNTGHAAVMKSYGLHNTCKNMQILWLCHGKKT